MGDMGIGMGCNGDIIGIGSGMGIEPIGPIGGPGMPVMPVIFGRRGPLKGVMGSAIGGWKPY